MRVNIHGDAFVGLAVETDRAGTIFLAGPEIVAVEGEIVLRERPASVKGGLSGRDGAAKEQQDNNQPSHDCKYSYIICYFYKFLVFL